MQKQLQEKLNELRKNITTLQNEAKDAGSEVKDTFDEVLEALNNKQEIIQKKFEDFTSATADTWDDLKSGLEASLEELENSYTKAASYLEQKRENLYTSHIEARLEEFDQQIEELRKRINRIPEPELKAKRIEALAILHEKQEIARRRLKELQSAGADIWDDLKSEMYAALEEVEDAYEKTMSFFLENQEAYQTRLEAILTDLDRKIAALQEQADNAETENKAKINESIQVLREKQVVVRTKYREFKVARAKAWQEFKSDMDTMMEDLEQSYDQVTSHFQ
jgi:hypothetical protein